MSVSHSTPPHRERAAMHRQRRDDLLATAKRFDFRTMHLEPHRTNYTAAIRQAELAEHYARSLDAEFGR